ncbi:MAG: 3-oxoacyl-ACP reductase FabG [Acidimicrobiales bacterium]|nr:MAG: 3-oxoacyl-ACP reductase [marine actinobacterium MedAcidi-G1]HAQ04397.1 3-oxoacyl-ACP reductase FabG [Acidimicrobiaceae bacterium]|tara:strand:+ start:2144 stop:2857 length:714 start_codon:yes stop_codon:yes gene_type:complete
MERVVLITGGNRGIGLATAKVFAAKGNKVAITYRDTPPDGMEDFGIHSYSCDVTDEEHIDKTFKEVEETLGTVEILIANAGITRDSLAARTSNADFSEVLDTNLTGAFRTAKKALRGMMKNRWGRVIFVSSLSGRIGQIGQSSYAASKAALVGLSRSLAKEYASRDITVNVVAPGAIKTDMLEKLSENQINEYIKSIPLGRLGKPEEIGEIIAFLSSEHASYITGSVIPVDGGLYMG